MNKLLGVCFCYVVMACCTTASALPPLGLTQITPTIPTLFFSQPNLEIIGETAYLGMETGIWTVDSTGTKTFLPISHPLLGSSFYVTPVVEATNGNLYVGANFRSPSTESQPALFSLDQLSTPIITWDYGSVNGVGADLRTYGNIEANCFGCYEATWFYLNGSTEPLPFPSGSVPNNSFTLLYTATAQGYAIGEATVPMTAGIGPVMWTPEGEISFFTPFQFGDADSILDRSDADRPNIGWNNFDMPQVMYGDGRNFTIFKEDGSLFYDDFPPDAYRVTVSHGDFTVIEVSDNILSGVSARYAFYPGIVPGFDNRAVPLLDIFPELAAVDIDRVNSLASVDGYLYMTLSGADGTFLFGARDPSVAVPEPASMVFALFGAAAWFRRRR